jgi:hypothetical protein
MVPWQLMDTIYQYLEEHFPPTPLGGGSFVKPFSRHVQNIRDGGERITLYADHCKGVLHSIATKLATGDLDGVREARAELETSLHGLNSLAASVLSTVDNLTSLWEPVAKRAVELANSPISDPDVTSF